MHGRFSGTGGRDGSARPLFQMKRERRTMDKETIAGRLRINGIPFRPELPEKLEIYLRLLRE